MTSKNDYHKYVISDGKLVGRFEEMYENCEDPWNQLDSIKIDLFRQMTPKICENVSAKRILEVGCGFGQLCGLIQESLGEKADVMGIDISEAAISKAKKLYPGIHFQSADITKDLALINNFNPDLIIMTQITWYILDSLKTIFSYFEKNFSGKIIHQLAFYPKGVQQYGREYFTNPEEFFGYIGKNPEESYLRTIYDGSGNISGYDSLSILNFKH